MKPSKKVIKDSERTLSSEISNKDSESLNELSAFFDLLARYDFEDKQKEKLLLKKDFHEDKTNQAMPDL